MQSIIISSTSKLSPKHLPAPTFPLHHSAACCCWWHISAVCPSLSPPSHPLHASLNLSLLPFLASSPPVLSSEQPERTSPLKCRPARKHGSCPGAPPPALLFSSCCLCFMAAGSHILTSKSAWFRICIPTRGTHSAHKIKKTDRQTCRDRRRNAHTWMHRQTLTQTGVYTQT